MIRYSMLSSYNEKEFWKQCSRKPSQWARELTHQLTVPCSCQEFGSLQPLGKAHKPLTTIPGTSMPSYDLYGHPHSHVHIHN